MNGGVVLGVMGGMGVECSARVVPAVRRRKRRRLNRGGDVERGFLPSRRSSSRHQKMQQMQQLKLPAGPDVFLPLIDPVSTITWSDLRSKDGGADSIEEEGYSFRTDEATTSHPDPGWDDDDADDMADAGQDMVDAQTSPDAVNMSPTPPGLPCKIGASTATGRPSHSSTPAASADALHAGMYPLSPVSPVLTMSRGASRSKPGSMRSGMDPVAEHASGSGGGDHPQLRQLPSPPSSPDQYEPNYRTSTSRRRPSVTSSLTAPSVLPHRPRSSTTTSVPLAAAFQTSRLSGTPSKHASTLPPAHHRYPSLAVPTPRSRASSVSLEPIPDHSPLERPSDASRRMSTAEVRHRHPSTTGATQGSHPTTHSTSSGGSGHGSSAATHASHGSDQPRAPLPARHLDSTQRIPEYGEPGPSSYNYKHRSMHIERSPPLFTTSPSPLSPPPSARPFRPLPVPGAQAASSRLSTITSASASTSTGDPRGQALPPLVKKRDSPALRPLPASPFAQPGSSTPAGASARTRSSSVMSERSLPRQLPPLAPLPPLEFESDLSPHGDARSIRSRGK